MTAPAACPACGAAVRPDSPWCTLCYADLRPKPPEPPPEPEPQPQLSVPPQPESPLRRPDPLTAPLAAVAGPTWPCTTCGAANPIERDTCGACGSDFLAAARSDAPLLELPVVGDLTRLGRGQRFALAGGFVLALLLLILLLGLTFG